MWKQKKKKKKSQKTTLTILKYSLHNKEVICDFAKLKII